MKTKLISKTGTGKEFDLPKNFSVKIRPDILLKTFEALKFLNRQIYGAMEGAGAGYSASGIIRHRRHRWKSAYGRGISRVPRKIFSRHGASFNWRGATVASTVGGRKAHAPKAEKNLFKKINKKEFLVAFNSALSGTVNSKALENKYNKKIESGFVFSKDVLDMKSKEFYDLFKKVFGESFEKVMKKKSVRAGKGKLRGRKYKSNAGLLFVLGSKEKMKRTGIDIVNVNDLQIKDLAPNGVAGRIACFSEEAVKEIGEGFK